MNLLSKIGIAGVAASLLLTGCAAKTGGQEATGENDALIATEAPSANGGFGSDVDLKGVILNVSTPALFTPGEYASNYTKQERPNVMDVKVTNNSSQALDLTTLSLAFASGENNCIDILDGDNGIGGNPASLLEKGQTVSFKYGVGCSAKAGDPLTLNITIGTSIASIEGTLA